ncbi:hypothetical protein BGX21_003608 [Mortierella sp. AD011]|nr:hypothetical protein BGX21_003608 [Mortierella sp. AD011]
MDRKRVPGPELSVAPLVEYPSDFKRWTPLDEIRHDPKRQPEDMRPIYMGCFNPNSYGPRPVKKVGQVFSGKGILCCEIKFATFSCAKRRTNIRDPQERELSQILSQALSPAIQLDKLPKSAIDIYITVLESDGWGSCIAAAITAASVALAHAGIEMLDLVAGCSAAYIQTGPSIPSSSSSKDSIAESRPPQIFMDADLEEEKYEQGAIVLAYMPSLNEVTHVLQSGKAEGSIISQSVEHCMEACNKIYAVMHHALLESINDNKEAL